MLLRRVIENVKSQNWTAVGLDFVIVVVGVFMGLQVQQWANARADRRDEAQILSRLHQEIELAIANRTLIGTRVNTHMEDLYTVRKMLFGFQDLRPLSQNECDAITRSHLTPQPGDTLPIVQELIATGRIALIRNGEIRSISTSILQQREQARGIARESGAKSIVLSYEFSELVTDGITPTPDPEDRDGMAPRAICNTEGMLANRRFLNAIAINVFNYNDYIDFTFTRPAPLYEALHKVVDAELGIRHRDVAP